MSERGCQQEAPAGSPDHHQGPDPHPDQGPGSPSPPAVGNRVTVVLGAQWGDEGKGKVVDLIAQDADIVCRCQVGGCCLLPFPGLA